jgi:hypothetical protein
VSDDTVVVEIGAHLVNPEAARNDAEDLAWDHAKFAAAAAGIGLDSDEFTFVFNTLRERYLVSAEYLEFYTYNALILIRTLINTGKIKLTHELPITDTGLAEELGELAQFVVSSYAWLLAGQDLLWPRNESMPHVGVTFRFPSTDIIITQE